MTRHLSDVITPAFILRSKPVLLILMIQLTASSFISALRYIGERIKLLNRDGLNFIHPLCCAQLAGGKVGDNLEYIV